MPPKIENETPAEKIARIREKARLRQLTYYEKHKPVILKKRKDEWQNLKNQVHQETLAKKTPKDYEPEPQPEPEIYEPVSEATPVPQKKQRGRPKGAIKKTKCKTVSKYTTQYVIDALKKIDNKSKGTTKINVDKVLDLQAIVNPSLDCDWEKGLSQPTLIIKKIDEALKKNSTDKFSINSKLIYFNLILKIIDNVIPELVSVKPIYVNYKDVLKVKGVNEDKTKLVNVYRYDILKKKIFDKFKPNSKERLLTSLYGEITVRDNFSKLKIIKNKNQMVMDKETNYLILPNSANKKRAHVYLQKYKTSNRYEDLDFECSKELTDEIMAYYEANISKIDKTDYLFGVSKLTGYIGTMLKKIGIDNKGMAINYFRHSVALSLDKNADEQSMVNLAKNMGHDVFTHMRYTSHNLIIE